MATNATANLTAQDHFTTTLSAGITSSDTTISLNAVPSGTEGFLVIDPDNSSKEIIFYNSKTSNTVVVPSTGDRGRGGTSAVSHSSGATVKMMVNSDYVKEMQNGHAMGNAFLIPNHLVASTGTSWDWQSFTPTWTNWTVGTGGSATNVGTYLQIGKTVFFRVMSILGSSGQSVGSSPYLTLPVTAKSNYVSGSFYSHIGEVLYSDAGVTEYFGRLRIQSTTTAYLLVSEASASYGRMSDVTSTVPFTWGAGDGLSLWGIYEAA